VRRDRSTKRWTASRRQIGIGDVPDLAADAGLSFLFFGSRWTRRGGSARQPPGVAHPGHHDDRATARADAPCTTDSATGVGVLLVTYRRNLADPAFQVHACGAAETTWALRAPQVLQSGAWASTSDLIAVRMLVPSRGWPGPRRGPAADVARGSRRTSVDQKQRWMRFGVS